MGIRALSEATRDRRTQWSKNPNSQAHSPGLALCDRSGDEAHHPLDSWGLCTTVLMTKVPRSMGGQWPYDEDGRSWRGCAC